MLETGLFIEIDIGQRRLAIDRDIEQPPAGGVDAGAAIPRLGEVQFDLVIALRRGEAIAQSVTAKTVGGE